MSQLPLATRGSALARWQAETTAARLGTAHPGLARPLVVVESSGDLDQESALARFGRIGIFTVEVDRAVLDGRARVGVHSLKDMTTTLQEGIVLAAVLERGPVEDVLVHPDGLGLADLPRGARVATGSLRRRALLLAARPDLEVLEIRGNVDTRLAKLERGEADALVLARAGLVRLGLDDRPHSLLGAPAFLPAVGQGIVGLTCRADDGEARELLAALNHRPSWHAARAERALLRELHGGCNAPIAAHARPGGAGLELEARVLSTDGRRCVAGTLSFDPDLPDADEAAGRALAADLAARGAAALVEAARA